MTSSEDDYFVALETVYEAVRDYARPEMDGLVRKLMYRLQRFPASGIYGNDYIFKTQWDEYCHEIQERLFGYSVDFAWDHTIAALIDDLIEHIPRRAAVLLSTFAAWELDEDEKLLGSFWPDGIGRVLKTGLNEVAGARNLLRFSPWKNE